MLTACLVLLFILGDMRSVYPRHLLHCTSRTGMEIGGIFASEANFYVQGARIWDPFFS